MLFVLVGGAKNLVVHPYPTTDCGISVHCKEKVVCLLFSLDLALRGVGMGEATGSKRRH